MTMKAYRAEFDEDEWCVLVHGETAGKAKARFMRVQPDPWFDKSMWTEIRLKRIPGCDDKPFTFENCQAAGFYYLDEDGESSLESEFYNYCDCPICKEQKP